MGNASTPKAAVPLDETIVSGSVKYVFSAANTAALSKPGRSVTDNLGVSLPSAALGRCDSPRSLFESGVFAQSTSNNHPRSRTETVAVKSDRRGDPDEMSPIRSYRGGGGYTS